MRRVYMPKAAVSLQMRERWVPTKPTRSKSTLITWLLVKQLEVVAFGICRLGLAGLLGMPAAKSLTLVSRKLRLRARLINPASMYKLGVSLQMQGP